MIENDEDNTIDIILKVDYHWLDPRFTLYTMTGGSILVDDLPMIKMPEPYLYKCDLPPLPDGKTYSIHVCNGTLIKIYKNQVFIVI